MVIIKRQWDKTHYSLLETCKWFSPFQVCKKTLETCYFHSHSGRNCRINQKHGSIEILWKFFQRNSNTECLLNKSIFTEAILKANIYWMDFIFLNKCLLLYSGCMFHVCPFFKLYFIYIWNRKMLLTGLVMIPSSSKPNTTCRKPLEKKRISSVNSSLSFSLATLMLCGTACTPSPTMQRYYHLGLEMPPSLTGWMSFIVDLTGAIPHQW